MTTTKNCLLLIFFIFFIFNVQSKQLKCTSEYFKQPKSATKDSKVNVCQSASCTAAGKSMYQAIDFCADPCEDFFAFACGRLVADHPLSEDSSGNNTFTLMTSDLDELLKQLLTSQSPSKSSAKSVALSKDLYKECLDVKSRRKLNFAPLQKELLDIFGFEWPASKETKLVSETLMEVLVRFIQIEKSPIIDLFIDRDINDTMQTIFYFNVPEGFDKDQIIYLDQERYALQIGYYLSEMYNLTQQIVNAEEPGSKEDTVLEIISAIWEFEKALVNASTPIEKLSDPRDSYNKMSLKEFEDITENGFDWSSLVKLLVEKFNLSINVTKETKIIVGDVEYFKKLPKILSETPLYVLYNYLGMSFLYNYRNQSDFSIEEQCLTVVTNMFDQAVSRMYVDEYVPENTKQHAAQFIADIRTSFRHVIKKDASWLDEEAKSKVLAKESVTMFDTAFPDYILDDSLLDDHYGLNDEKVNLQVKKGHFLETMLKIRRHRMLTFSQKMDYIFRGAKLGAANVNAHADKYSNEVYLPAGIFQSPLFDADLPPLISYLNYASIGFIISHEIIHLYDSEGRFFNDQNHLVNGWWSKGSEENFEKGARCFAHQYDSLNETQSKKHLKGNFTLAENIADNGGLHVAYDAAFRVKARKRKLLVPAMMEVFTPEQLFFVRYARTWCANYDDETMAMSVDTDDHSPEKYRVNVPLANFEPFSRAYDCPVGSKMNPSKKCVLW